MRVVIIGCGMVGAGLASILVERGDTVTPCGGARSGGGRRPLFGGGS